MTCTKRVYILEMVTSSFYVYLVITYCILYLYIVETCRSKQQILKSILQAPQILITIFAQLYFKCMGENNFELSNLEAKYF